MSSVEDAVVWRRGGGGLGVGKKTIRKKGKGDFSYANFGPKIIEKY